MQNRTAPTKQPPSHAPNAALLIDFDNVTMGIRSDLQQELRRLLNSDIIRGKVAVQRAYADWRRYPQYIVPLSEASIDLIFAPAFGSNKKNATDIRLAIDALELVFIRPEIGTYILLSGDSDFSAMVMKLKEYGKYVIGVGIRESSSDLLIQNCDEYYSYNELAGLKKVSDEVVERRDPWELVVDAVLEMKKRHDVMRSDRLKQVMQDIDPSFDEKNVGMSRFSKFVDEARRRGLITANKLENGQSEIDLGPNAPGGDKALAPIPGGTEDRQSRERAETDDDTRGPRRGRRGERRKDQPAAPPAPGALTLAEGFDLLRRAMGELAETTNGDGRIGEDAIRERMVALYDKSDEILTHRPRFGRFLRQAHDAKVVDIAKGRGGYEVKLLGDAPVKQATEATEARETTEETEAKTTKGGRGRGRGRGKKTAEKTTEPAETASVASVAPIASVASVAVSRSPLRSRSAPRSGATATQIPLVGVVELDEPAAPAAAAAKPAAKKTRARKAAAPRTRKGKSGGKGS